LIILNNVPCFIAKEKREMIRKKILLVLVSLVVVAIALPCLAGNVTYEYDDLYRLIKATYSDGTVIEYFYDTAGNRVARVILHVNTYYVLTPELAASIIRMVSLADGNVITAGSTVLNLDKYESGEIPANAVSPGGVIGGIAPFSV
jgi:YD repeat-containing protein